MKTHKNLTIHIDSLTGHQQNQSKLEIKHFIFVLVVTLFMFEDKNQLIMTATHISLSQFPFELLKIDYIFLKKTSSKQKEINFFCDFRVLLIIKKIKGRNRGCPNLTTLYYSMID